MRAIAREMAGKGYVEESVVCGAQWADGEDGFVCSMALCLFSGGVLRGIFEGVWLMFDGMLGRYRSGRGYMPERCLEPPDESPGESVGVCVECERDIYEGDRVLMDMRVRAYMCEECYMAMDKRALAEWLGGELCGAV